MKKNIICFMAWVIVTLVIWGIYFKTWNTISKTSSQPSFEDKEKCMKYYDSYKKNLESLYNSDDNSREEYGYTRYLSDYEFFYSKELDSCICAYSLRWATYDTDDNMKPYPDYWYYIVDYLNWEKELFGCYTSTYMDYLNWKQTDWWTTCWNQRRIEKEKYKN